MEGTDDRERLRIEIRDTNEKCREMQRKAWSWRKEYIIQRAMRCTVSSLASASQASVFDLGGAYASQ